MFDSVFEQFSKGDNLALARLITMVEQDSSQAVEVIKRIFPFTGKSHIIGITGPPGAGKSTIIDKLISIFRREELSVGVVAVDPSSPCSGGAVLGDRVRMQNRSDDEKVFIRSMATRGNSGGLPASCRNVVNVLDAFGRDFTIVETAGVGQTELQVAEIADTTIVVLVPESGDFIQAMKAGILEIADIFVINKADRLGAENIAMDLEFIVMRNNRQDWWKIPVLMTQATNDVRIDELYTQINNHRDALIKSGKLALNRQRQRKDEFLRLLTQRTMEIVTNAIDHNQQMMDLLEMVSKGALDPYSASDQILNKISPIVANNAKSSSLITRRK